MFTNEQKIQNTEQERQLKDYGELRTGRLYAVTVVHFNLIQKDKKDLEGWRQVCGKGMAATGQRKEGAVAIKAHEGERNLVT